jgi:hypothetical protein
MTEDVPRMEGTLMPQRRYTAEMAVDLRVPFDVRLSPDGAKVVFRVEPIGHREKDRTATILVAPTDASAPPRAITGSEHNNVAARRNCTSSRRRAANRWG